MFNRDKWTAAEIAAYARHMQNHPSTPDRLRDDYRQLAVMHENGNYRQHNNQVGTVKKPSDPYHRHNWPR